MTKEIDSLYQAIGSEAMLATDGLSGRLVVYAEVEEGLIAPALYYQRGTDRSVHFEFCSSRLSDMLYALWECWRETPDYREWRTLAFVIDAGRFFVDLVFPEQVDPDETAEERRKRLVGAYFAPPQGDSTAHPAAQVVSDAANDPHFELPTS